MDNLPNKNIPTDVANYLYALEQKNLVYNSHFKYFSNQKPNGTVVEYGIPDGWLYEDTGTNGSINFDETTNTCVIKKSSGNEKMIFKQYIHEFPRWEEMLIGKIISAKIILNISIAGLASITLSDGFDSNTITKNGPGQFEVDLKLKINTAAKFVYIAIESKEPFITLSISKVCANVGLITLSNLQCIIQGTIGQRKQYIATETPPAEELSLCREAIELGENFTRLDSVLNKRFGKGSNGRSMLIDMRGYFSRAWDNGATVDPDASNRKEPGTGNIKGDHVSTYQQDVFLKHNHGLNFNINKTILTGDKVAATVINTTDSSKTKDEKEGKETRPKNIAELYTIKWA